jgi:hypothetical protein
MSRNHEATSERNDVGGERDERITRNLVEAEAEDGNGRMIVNGHITNAGECDNSGNVFIGGSEPAPVITSGRPEKIRNISISGLNFGYVVEIGCQSFAVETPEKLCAKLLEYMKNPQTVEREWFNGGFKLNDEAKTSEQ